MTGKNTSSLLTATKHQDKRTNIPTEELKAFMEEDEQNPKTVLYPRDPSLDPQLVWKSKDGQDSQYKATKCALTRNLWVPAINNHGGSNRWAFIEITDPWNVATRIIESTGTMD